MRSSPWRALLCLLTPALLCLLVVTAVAAPKVSLAQWETHAKLSSVQSDAVAALSVLVDRLCTGRLSSADAANSNGHVTTDVLSTRPYLDALHGVMESTPAVRVRATRDGTRLCVLSCCAWLLFKSVWARSEQLCDCISTSPRLHSVSGVRCM